MKMRYGLKLVILGTAFAMIAAACGTDATDDGTTATQAEGTTAATQDAGAAEEKTAATEAMTDDGAMVERSGTLLISVSTFPNSIIPPNAAERNATNVSHQIFDGLTWVDDDGNIVGALAESWTISDDGRDYVFQLRGGVIFHDGTTLDCQDVVDTFALSSDAANAYAYEYEIMTLTGSVECGATELEVLISTEEPDPLLLRKMPDFGITSSEMAAQGLQAWEEQIIGAGAFKLVEWVKGERIDLVAHDEYWDSGYPLLEGVTYFPIPEESTRLAAVQTGTDLHIAQRLSADQAAVLDTIDGVDKVGYAVDRVYYIAFNNLTTGIGTPIENVLVRQAMNYAVDRQAIVDALFEGNAALANGYITSENLGFDDSIGVYPYDPQKAMDLLAEAGLADGFEIGMACPSGAYTNFEQVCEAVGGYLNAVGITFTGGGIDFQESGQYWDAEAAKELPPLFGDSWSTSLGEAISRLQGALLAENSFAAWEEPTIKEAIDTIAITVDPVERAALYSELHRYMFDNPPFIYLYQPFTFEGVSARVSGYSPRAEEGYWLKFVSLAAA